MFLIAKLALVTCLLYLAIALLIEGLFFLLALSKGGILCTLDPRVWAGVFLVVWLASFLDAWRITVGAFIAKVPRPPIA
ncbi:MAG TPA: hypothetical protein VFF64_18660 [Candidatus Eremiobacteraceae bacterium]|nr:hypothetical protein [Candidatus Eremiobacteraceae bacterium]